MRADGVPLYNLGAAVDAGCDDLIARAANGCCLIPFRTIDHPPRQL